ncbi:MAG TPA: RyR domain-containing protein [Pyrinomonadaceae bacterium]|nr:RyR domain-containing protein [Pyrinomonadaceae bacterium]
MNSRKLLQYQPEPISLEGVEIGIELTELVEALARNAHDVWACQRLADGWCWGEERNDTAKTHPCLVHYDDLPDSEKVYDLNVVSSTIRAIIALGFRISREAQPEAEDRLDQRESLHSSIDLKLGDA